MGSKKRWQQISIPSIRLGARLLIAWLKPSGRYHIALMEKRTVEEIQLVARDLDEARSRYRAIADQIE